MIKNSSLWWYVRKYRTCSTFHGFENVIVNRPPVKTKDNEMKRVLDGYRPGHSCTVINHMISSNIAIQIELPSNGIATFLRFLEMRVAIKDVHALD